MNDCIKREDAIAVIYGQHIGGKEACENARPNTFGADLREIVFDIEDIPAADAVEVVRCKDCIHAKVNANVSGKPLICYLTRRVGEVDGNWFCADGERRSE